MPPSDNLAITLSIGELFVALFLTVEILLEVVFQKTKAERGRIKNDPLLLLDIVALIASWAYILDLAQTLRMPELKQVFSIGRVARTLRPLRTLRMLSSIDTVTETIVDAVPLFGQVGAHPIDSTNYI
jgi:hypothetical protein